MLNSNSPRYLHLAQNLGLILTSLLFLPLTTALLFLSYATSIFLSTESSTKKIPSSPKPAPSASQSQKLITLPHAPPCIASCTNPRARKKAT